jgi:type VI secretion system protein ImpH
MATPGRRADAPLERTLFDEPYRFDFFQAVRLLERLAPDRAPVGRDGPSGREVVRFHAHQSLGFPASAIHRLDPPRDAGAPPDMTIAFLGLTGPLGALPHVYTELVLERLRAGDRTLAAFLDLFNHRMASLFFRAWEKYRPVAAREPAGEGQFARCLFALIGLGLDPLRGRHAFADVALLYDSGSFARRQRPAVVLEALLRDAFALPVEVHQFRARWLRLEPGDRSCLGADGPHNALGVDLVLGERVLDEQGSFRLRIGPLTFAEFRALLPETTTFRRLAQMTRLFVDGEFDFDVQLVLRADEVPGCVLSSTPGEGARLGCFAWLKSRAFERDADEAIFEAGV